MKILFTNSPLHFTHGHTFTQPDWQTLVLPTLAAIVGNKHDIRLSDNMTLFLMSNETMRCVREFKPEIVGFSIIAARDIFNTLRVIMQVRQANPRLTLIAGGQGTVTFEDLLLQNGIDFVVRGESEATLKELIQIIAEKRSDYSFLTGISYCSDGVINRNPDRPLLKNLDDFRLLLHSQKRQKSFKRWYVIFNLLYIFLPDEIFKAVFHPNAAVRKIKQYGYIGILRHYFYKVFRKIGICDI